MKIWKFLFASGALAATEAQTTCFTSVVVAGATNDCEGLYGDQETCTTTCSDGGTITHTCKCHDAGGALLTDCVWGSTPGSSCSVNYHRIDFDVSYTAIGSTDIQTNHEPLLETYFKNLADPLLTSASVTISDWSDAANAANAANTDVTCKVTLRFDAAVTSDGWAGVAMYDGVGAVRGDAFDFSTVSTALDTSLTTTNIDGTSTVAYEQILASNPNAATDLLREVDAKETVLATITEKKAELAAQQTLKADLVTEKDDLQDDIDDLKDDKTTAHTTLSDLDTDKSGKQDDLSDATQLVADKQAEITAVNIETSAIHDDTDAVNAEVAALQATLDGLVADLAALELVTAAKEVTITALNAKISDQDTEIVDTNSEIDTKNTEKDSKAQELQDAEDAYVVTQATKTQLEADKAAAQAALDEANATGDDLADDATVDAATFDANTATIAEMEAEIEAMKKKFKLFVLAGK